MTNKLVTGIAIMGALALSGLAVATPTQAAGFSFTFGGNIMHNGAELRFRNGHFDNNYCLSSREIRTELRDNGFRSVQIIRELGRHTVLAVGRKGAHWYQLVVNSCTGAVDQQRVRSNTNGNFSFTLTFGAGQAGHGYPDHGGDNGGPGNGGMGNGGPGNGGQGDGGSHEKLVCYVTFFDASQVAAGADADVQRAQVMSQLQAQAIDKPNDRSAIFEYGSDQQTISTCSYLDHLN